MFKRRKADEPEAAPPAGRNDIEASASGDVAMTAPADSGLGVPPFRPASSKEASDMSRPPFTPSPAGPATPAAPATAPAAPPRPASISSPFLSRDPGERRTLVVGRGISLQGTVQDAERLVVEGTVEANMLHATELAICPGGMFKGEVEVEDSEIAGTFNGTLTVRGSLVVRAAGKILGQARCRRLQVEDGGHISGTIEMLTDGAKPDMPVRAPAIEHAG